MEFDDREFAVAVFCIPKVAGHIYVGARSLESVRRLCVGIYNIFMRTMFVVPIAERVALLEGYGLSDRKFEEGTLVKVRNGTYKDDLGTVFSASTGNDSLTLKIKCRDALPGELKRKRKKTRRDPYTLSKEFAKSIGKGLSSEDFGKKQAFKFRNKIFTFDGHLLLDIRYDRVKRAETIARQDVPNDPSDSHLTIQKFLRNGSNIWIVRGDLAGAAGFIVDFTSCRTALVDIGKVDPTLTSTLFEVDLNDIVRRFEMGDLVDIILGIEKGRRGFVSSVDYKKGLDRAVVEIADTYQAREVRCVNISNADSND